MFRIRRLALAAAGLAFAFAALGAAANPPQTPATVATAHVQAGNLPGGTYYDQ